MNCNEFRNIVADLFDKDVDPQIKAECEKHIRQCSECREYYEDLLMAAERLRPKQTFVSSDNNQPRITRRWSRVAAIFVGMIILSGIAFAAIHLIRQQTQEEPSTVMETNSQPSTLNSQLTTSTSPVRFEDVRLDSILDIVSTHYGKAVHFDNNKAKAMKFIMTWEPDAPLANFIDVLNMFDGLQLTLEGDTIFVATQEEKEEMQ